jgi:hypothetical protein
MRIHESIMAIVAPRAFRNILLSPYTSDRPRKATSTSITPNSIRINPRKLSAGITKRRMECSAGIMERRIPIMATMEPPSPRFFAVENSNTATLPVYYNLPVLLLLNFMLFYR